jgi:hypothetical protein
MKTHRLTPITKLGQYLPSVLGRPEGIAVLLSLVFHGILFAAGPSFSSLQRSTSRDDLANPLARKVPVVELTPEEQNRLPNFDGFDYSLAPHQGNDLQSFPGLQDLTVAPTAPSKALDPLDNLGLPKVPLGSPSLGISPLPPSLGRSLFLPAPPLIPRRSSRNNGPTDTDRAIAAELARRSQQNRSIPMPSSPSATNQAANPNRGNRPADRQPAEVNGLADRYRDLRARLQFSAEKTTDAEVTTASQTWLDSIEKTLGETPPTTAPAPLTVEIPYDLRICLTPSPAPGLVGLVKLPGEDPNAPEISTTLLKSTGYPFLNETALEAVKTKAKAADPPLSVGTLYQVVVNINYDNKTCVSAETLLKPRSSSPAPPETASPETPAADPGSNP